MNCLVSAGMECGLMVSADKTKVLVVGGGVSNMAINGIKMEQVSSFMYLGSVITDDAECSTDIKVKLPKVKELFQL